MPVKYKVVDAETVDCWLAHGWVLYGNPFPYDGTIAQAMTHY